MVVKMCAQEFSGSFIVIKLPYLDKLQKIHKNYETFNTIRFYRNPFYAGLAKKNLF